MTQQINFLNDESGAVTVDWVVLTAALVGLGLAVMGVLSSGVESVTDDVDGTLRSDTIIRTSFTGNAVGAAAGACAGAGTHCADNHGYAASELQGLSNADLASAISDFNDAGFDTAAGVATTNLDNNLYQNDQGVWGSDTGVDNAFVADTDANTNFANAQANDAYGAALSAEDAARANN